MTDSSWIKDLLIVLATAGVVVPLFSWLRIGIVPGFLVAGVLLGPGGLGHLVDVVPWLKSITFSGPERVERFAELGVVFLLFLIGLEFSLDRLWQMRKLVFGVGPAQFGLATLFVLGAIFWFTETFAAALVIALALAMSSTAVGSQVLIEARRFGTPAGRISLAVLLFQDLMVVPVVIVVGLLSGEGAILSAGVVVRAVGLAVAAIAIIIFAGRFLVGPLLRLAASTGSRETVIAIAMFLAIGTGLVTASVGLSAALGAFLAGILLGESAYRHQLEVDLEPFKGLLLGLFFMTVGMAIDVVTLVQALPLLILSLVGLIVLKVVAMTAAGRIWRLPLAPTIESAFVLAGAGEFAFVVFALARGARLIGAEMLELAVTVAALSMLATPLVAALGRSIALRIAQRKDGRDHGVAEAPEMSDHVVIGGFGRVGEMIARLLEAEDIPYVALDLDADRVAEQRQGGRHVYYGDASRAEILDKVGGRNARAFVVTTDAPDAAELMVKAVRTAWPEARVHARAIDSDHANRLAGWGASDVVPEALEGSLQLAGRVLAGAGIPEDVVEARLAMQRDAEIRRLAEAARRALKT
jgi:CPA2 family monovalent cation:H+ antiporter-2